MVGQTLPAGEEAAFDSDRLCTTLRYKHQLQRRHQPQIEEDRKDTQRM